MMTKKDFCSYLAKKQGIPVSKATEMTDCVFNALKDCVVENKKVVLRNLFTLEVVTQPAKSGTVNGRPYSSTEKNKVKITSSKAFNDMVQ